MITSHRKRIKKAKIMAELMAECSEEKNSRALKKACAKVFLLEDIVDLYESRLKKEKDGRPLTRAGELARERNILQFQCIIKLFHAAIDVATSIINAGNYKIIDQAISERKLMYTAERNYLLPKLRGMVTDILDGISRDLYRTVQENQNLEEDLTELVMREETIAKYKDLPSLEEIKALIETAEKDIPDLKSV